MQKINWNKFWDSKATEDFIASSGKTSSRKEDFFLYIFYIIKNLKGLNREDIVLDVGAGAGYLSYCISPLVKKLYSFDFSKKLLIKSKLLNKNRKNIEIYHDNILFMNETFRKKKVFNKIIVGSVLQYLKNYDEIEKVFQNLNNISSTKSLILFTHNPDKIKKSSFIKTYKNLNWHKKKLERSLKMENQRFWLDYKKIKILADKNGFKSKKIKIDKKFFQSTHMFDLLIERKNVQ